MRNGGKWAAIVLTAAVVGAVSTTYNRAQPAGAPAAAGRIAVVDLVRVFNDFEQTIVVNDKMKVFKNEVAREADAKMQEINADQQALNAFDPNSTEYFKRRSDVRKKMLEYKVWEELKKDWIAEEHLRWAKRTYAMVTDEIARIARARGVQLVVTREDVIENVTDTNVLYQQILNRKVVYSDPGIELTDEVLGNLNAAFAKAGGASSIKLGP